MSRSVYFTRCPVPTATGIALERGIVAELYAGTPYELRDIAELGDADAHYTHSVARAVREGGGSPPVWARARGADTRLLAITFMDEMLGIFVRRDDPARNVADLAGRRIGLPRWPALAFDFWRFAAEKGFHSALRCHALADAAVSVVDIVEGGDVVPARNEATGARGGAARTDQPSSRRSPYRNQLRALLDGRIDAMFGKGLELERLEREAQGRIRMLFDVATSPELADRVNNSTPRLVTAGAALVDDDPEAAVRYLQALLRAAAWAAEHVELARDIIGREANVAAAAVDRYLCSDYARRLAPRLDDELLRTVDVLKSFLAARGYVDRDVALDAWVDPLPLREALRRESDAAGAAH